MSGVKDGLYVRCGGEVCDEPRAPDKTLALLPQPLANWCWPEDTFVDTHLIELDCQLCKSFVVSYRSHGT